MTNVAEGRQQDEGARERAASAVQDAASTTQEKAMELRSRGTDQLRQQLDSRTTDAGRQAQEVGRALKQTGEQLRSDGKSQAAGITEAAAERVEHLGRYLESVSGNELLDDAERFARRRPWLLAGIGLVVGVAASRMMKVSSERRYSTTQPQFTGAGGGA
jgi:ElaB/YqjD/DUF883 family membrane-anchored ribosome-binding protein